MFKKRLKNINIQQINFREMLWIVLELCIILYPVGIKCYYEHNASFFITSILFALPLVALLALWQNTIWRHSVIVVSALCSIIETTMVVMYKGFITAGNILAVATTNPNEASGFATHALHVLWYLIPIFVTAISAIWLYKNNFTQWKRNLLFLLISSCIAWAYVGYKQLFFYHGVLTMNYYIKNRILNRPPYNIGYQLVNVYKMQRIRKYIDESDSMSFNAVKQDTLSLKEIYVLGIGESMRYENFSMNGTYFRSTTPRLESEPNVTLYTDYYSEACLTMWSVPMLLTRATPFDFETNYKEKAVFKPFKEAGFKAFTIANYDNLLKYETYLSRGNDGLIIVQHDSIIPHVIDSLANQHEKLFVTFQFIGNHHPYWNYTQEFNVYHPNLQSDSNIDSDSLYINSYDNTFLYMDYLLTQVIHSIDRDNTVSSFIYVSDHGQHVNAKGGGHGGDCSPKKVEYHVPMIFWHSKKWKETYIDKYNNMTKHRNSPINGDNIFYSLIDMANIEINSNTPPAHLWSVFADTLAYHERYVLLPDGVNVFKCE